MGANTVTFGFCTRCPLGRGYSEHASGGQGRQMVGEGERAAAGRAGGKGQLPSAPGAEVTAQMLSAPRPFRASRHFWEMEEEMFKAA